MPGTYGLRTVIDGDIDVSDLRAEREFVASVLELMKKEGRPADWMDIVAAMSNAWFAGVYRRPNEIAGMGRGIRQEAVRFLEGRHYPRYYFATEMVSVRDRHEFVRALRSRRFSRQVAFVSQPAFFPAAGTVLAQHESANHARLDVEARGRAFLVMSVTPHKYWRITIDGHEVPAIVTNIGYQGVVVPPGRHIVEMRYRNPLVATGAAVSAATLLALVLMLRNEARREGLRRALFHACYPPAAAMPLHEKKVIAVLPHTTRANAAAPYDDIPRTGSTRSLGTTVRATARSPSRELGIVRWCTRRTAATRQPRTCSARPWKRGRRDNRRSTPTISTTRPSSRARDALFAAMPMRFSAHACLAGGPRGGSRSGSTSPTSSDHVENATFYVYPPYHSGFRAYTKRFLETVNFDANSDDSCSTRDHRPGRGQGLASPSPIRTDIRRSLAGRLRRGTRYGLAILKTMIFYKCTRRRSDPSVSAIAAGAAPTSGWPERVL